MNKITIGVIVIVLVALGGVALVKKTAVEYIAPEPVEVQVDALEKAIEDAKEAHKQEATDLALKAYNEAYEAEMKKVELAVIKDYNYNLDIRQKELEKQQADY